MEQLHYNLLYRWFIGLGVDDQVSVPTVFTKNRDRLLKPRWRANSWPSFSLIGTCAPCFRTTTFPSTARRFKLGHR